MGRKIREILKSRFSHSNFRPGQEEAIETVQEGKNVILVMPTGSGKSLCYQLPSVINDGITVVISPLISLMKDQVDKLRMKNNIPASAIHSNLSKRQRQKIMNELGEDSYDLIYVSPERLKSKRFLQIIRNLKVNLIAVDEAHCISEWGHDFRPSYLQIPDALEQMDKPPVLAATATATKRVRMEIGKKLTLKKAKIIMAGFNRPNLYFQVKYADNEDSKRRHLYNLFNSPLMMKPTPAIIYVGTRQQTEELPDFLKEVCDLDALPYHGGMESKKRPKTQNVFMNDDVPVIVATKAFGMGIHKNNVRSVIHYSMPGTLEEYYQQAGRAGRDRKPARATLIYSPQDRSLQEWFINNGYPTADEVQKIYRYFLDLASQKGAKTDDGVTINYKLTDMCTETGIRERRIKVGISLLRTAGLLEDLDYSGRLRSIIIYPDESFNLKQIAGLIGKRKNHRRNLLRKMIDYAETNHCRRKKILKYFGDKTEYSVENCCDNCLTSKGQKKVELEDPETAHISRMILKAISNLHFKLGEYKIAQLLTGSEAKKILKWDLDKHAQYGKLRRFTQEQVRKLLSQMVEQGLLKKIGGSKPTIKITPFGHQVRKQNKVPPPLDLPSLRKRRHSKRASKGNTYRETWIRLQKGMSVSEIAKDRGLTKGTIYKHCESYIRDGKLKLNRIVSKEDQKRIKKVVKELGNPDRLKPIKSHLPDRISYGEIRCVLVSLEIQRDQTRKSYIDKEIGLQVLKTLDITDKKISITATAQILAGTSSNHFHKRGSASHPLYEPLPDLTQKRIREVIHKMIKRGILDGKRGSSSLKITKKGREFLDEREGRKKDFATRLIEYKKKDHPKPLEGPWQEGWTVGFYSWFQNEDQLSQVGHLLHRYKYEHKQELVTEIAKHCAKVMEEKMTIDKLDFMIPVPGTRKNRPFDVVGLLCEEISELTGIRLGKDLLRKVRKTRQQKEMANIQQKKQNVRNAFRVEKPELLKNQHILIVDDIYDSGATLEEITGIVNRSGASAISIFTVARTRGTGRLE